jgi:hypothetical protein
MQSWRWVLAVMLAAGSARAQWEILPSGSTADLRGIHNVGNGVVWASGTGGTVLRTTNDGKDWQRCATPPGAEHLDFRGIQAFDASTAIVMSSGKGPLSRLYKTTDACQTWTLLFTNPDPEGFWDTVAFSQDFDIFFIIGDPVGDSFRVFSAGLDEETSHVGKLSDNWNGHPIKAAPGESGFAASNSLFAYNVGDGMFSFVTGGSRSEIIHEEHGISGDPKVGMFSEWSRGPLPFKACESCGAFSIAASPYVKQKDTKAVVVVGGDYQHPDDSTQTSAFSKDWGNTFLPSQTPPHGYRSAVAYDAGSKTWITVGPNGTDISTDDGRNWRALRPNPALHEPADADQHWNALSLPYVVGPHGRIGKLRPDALTTAPKGAKP